MSHPPASRKQASAGLAVFALSALLAGLVPAVSVPTPAQAQTCTPVSTANLTGHWKFDENAPATVAQDSTGGNNGTYVNGPVRSSGTTLITPNPAARTFDGTNDYVTVNNSNDFTFGNNSFTVSLFAKTGTGNRAVMGNFNGSNRGWGLYFYPNQVNFFGYGNQGTNDVPKGSATLLNNQWHHIAGVYTRSGSSLRIDTYVDGTLIGTNTSTVGNITSSSALLFGHYLGQPYFDGSLDDIRIYGGRTLSQSEIASLAAGCGNAGSSSSSSSLSSVSSSVSSSSSLSSMSSSSSLSSTGSSVSSSSSLSSGISSTSSSSLSSLSSSVSSVCTVVPLTGLSAYWKFDETSGAANDSTGFNNSGSLLNGATRTSSGAPLNYANPRALSLDGGNDYVLVPNTTNLPTGAMARTVSLWFNADSLGGYSPLVTLGNGTTGQKFIVMQGNVGGTHYVFTDGVNTANNVTLTGSQIPTTSAWHHLAFTYNGSGAWQYYLDGSLLKSGTFPVAINTNTNDVEIGSRHDAVTGFFDGRIDDARLYNRVLSASEIASFASGCGNAASSASSSSVSSLSSSSLSSLSSASSLSSTSSMSSLSSASSVSSGAIPQCEGQNATIYVRNGRIVGGTQSGATFNGFLNGTNGNDVIVGTSGNDYIRGNAGNDRVCARAGNDYVNGDQGDDVIRGGDGNDSLYGGNGTDTISGNAGNDNIFGGNGEDVLCGNANGDYVQGQNANDQIDGGAGSDNLFGGSGNNTCANGEFANGCNQTVNNIPACSNNNE